MSLHLVLAKRRSGHQWVMVSGLTALHYVGGQGRVLLWAPFALKISKGWRNQQTDPVCAVRGFLVSALSPYRLTLCQAPESGAAMITVPGSPRRNSLSAPVRDNKQGYLGGPEIPPALAPGQYRQEVWVVLPRPNCLDCTKLHARYLSWWS